MVKPWLGKTVDVMLADRCQNETATTSDVKR